jgi:Rrf2 family nitric oxide-sensitive transcriptional repressor
VECFDATTNACTLSPSCRLKRLFDDALAGYFKALDGATLADMILGPLTPGGRPSMPLPTRQRVAIVATPSPRRPARSGRTA